MTYKITYTTQAIEDLRKVENSAKLQILKAIYKVSENPLPYTEGGYGKPLGHKRNINLTNLLKIKLKRLGYRIVYQLQQTETTMNIIVIGIRSDEEVYKTAMKRLKNIWLDIKKNRAATQGFSFTWSQYLT